MYLRKFSDGTVVWTSPTGEIYRTTPGGLDLFPDMASSPACREPKPLRRNHSRQRTARGARIRRRNKIQRPINDAHSRLQRARRQEIANRKDRNRMRKTLFVLKGRPSTSPFMYVDQRSAWTRGAAARLAASSRTPPPPDDPPF